MPLGRVYVPPPRSSPVKESSNGFRAIKIQVEQPVMTKTGETMVFFDNLQSLIPIPCSSCSGKENFIFPGRAGREDLIMIPCSIF